MSRPIKFRAWNRALKEMWEHGQIEFGNAVLLHNHDDRPLELLQYTGLKDKSGVEIYEGDVVESFTHPEIPQHHIIEWSDKFKGWWMRNITAKHDNDGCIQLRVGEKYGPYEVIGNIYQHPELLERQEDE